MRRGLLVGVVAVVVTAGGAVAGPATPTPDGAPFVDAGLDQEAYVGDQVYLDGGGTWDDQGDITHKEWTIETPDGRTIQPDCPTCWFTSFFVNRTGQYDATLTVRDAEGSVNSDTLYVTVLALEDDMLRDPPNATVNDTDGGGDSGNADSDSCWVSNSAGEDPLVHDAVCSNHGTYEGYGDANMGDVSEGNHRRFAEFQDEGVVDEYSEHYNTGDGTVLVPVNVMNDEAEEIEDIVQNRAGNGVDRGGNNNNNNNNNNGGNSGSNQPGGDPGATGGGGGTSDGCYAPCGAYS